MNILITLQNSAPVLSFLMERIERGDFINRILKCKHYNTPSRKRTALLLAITMFYGVYALDIKQHHLPRIHVEYAQVEAAVFQIADRELLEGRFLINNKA